MSAGDEKAGNRTPEAGSGKAAATASGAAATDSLPSTALFRMPLDLRWRDLDAFGHVNNSNFMTYIEEARIRWFTTMDRPWVTDAIAPLLAAVQMNYRRPIPYPAQLAVELSCQNLGTTSATIGHRIVSGDDDGGRRAPVLYADGHVVMVWIDRASGRPTPLPNMIRKAIETQGIH